jgi:hypothetical protein
VSQVYVKKCDGCDKVAIMPNIPAPPGWHCLADAMHGTMVSFDICPECSAASGFSKILTKRIRDRALGDLKNQIESDPERYAEALPIAEIESAIARGDWDDAFAQGDGIDLAQIAAEQDELNSLADEITEAEIVGTYEDRDH